MAGSSRPGILHVDLDAFFVAVEVRDNPSLAGHPVVVGGTGRRGVVAAASYEARAYGVHSAMPIVTARRLCPHAVVLPGRFERYREASHAFHQILQRVTPLVEGIALDEAFLDVRGATRLLGDPAAIAARLRTEVAGELALSCSIGVAPRKLTAKLASEAAKPRASRRGPTPGLGIVVIEEADELEFLHAHPVAALWGVGPATRARLEPLGVQTVGDVAGLEVDRLVRAVGEHAGRHLHDLAWARDERAVEPEREAKSIGHEETFPVDLHDSREILREVARLADAVAQRLRRARRTARGVQLKVRYGDFRTLTRSVTLPAAVDTGPDLVAAARRLLAQVDLSPGVRLLGVSAFQLSETRARQLRLGEESRVGAEEVTGALDAIRDRFGDDAIVAGTAFGPGGPRPVRRGAQAWGPEDSGPTAH